MWAFLPNGSAARWFTPHVTRTGQTARIAAGCIARGWISRLRASPTFLFLSLMIVERPGALRSPRQTNSHSRWIASIKGLQWMQVLSGQSALESQTRSMFAPARQTPEPVQSDSCVQFVPAFDPPIQIPPLSQSSPASTTPLPQRFAVPIGVFVGVGVMVGTMEVGVEDAVTCPPRGW